MAQHINMKSTLVLQDTITIETVSGKCDIQLLYGDITKLSPAEKVDIIMVSAFPGDYASLRGTVIGALAYNLGISVRELSLDKEQDLRHHFSCWLSKPLSTQDSPYGRLLCFERYGYSKVKMLQTMVNGAASWMEGGLPLRCLKIVIYDNINLDVNKEFERLKKQWEARSTRKRKTSMTYDVYLCFDVGDQHWVSHIAKCLQNSREGLRVFASHQAFDKEKVWQDDIFTVMTSCKRVIAVFTPSFLENPECLELYNMAICCNRVKKSAILAPFYIISVPNMPNYLALVQWKDCRVRNEGEIPEVKIEKACAEIVKDLGPQPTSGEIETKDNDHQIGVDEDEDKLYAYDVFISYSHKNPSQAEALLQAFKDTDPKIKVFYDRSELTTGTNWLNILYQCVGLARCVISLMSDTYLSSSMCRDEYNIALARFLAKDDDMQFIPLCVADMDSIPSWFSYVKILDARGDNFQQVMSAVAQAVSDWLSKDVDHPELLSHLDDLVEYGPVFSTQRDNIVREQYEVDHKFSFQRKRPLNLQKDISKNSSSTEAELEKCDVAICYSDETLHCAAVFCHILDKLYPGLNIDVLNKASYLRLQTLETAKKIIVFISYNFLTSQQSMEELLLALNRQRSEKKQVLYLIQAASPSQRPFFPNLLPYHVSLVDRVWTQFEQECLKGKLLDNKKIVSTNRSDFMGSYTCDLSEFMGLTKLAEDVAEDLTAGDRIAPPIMLNVLQVKMESESQHDELHKNYSLEQCLKPVILPKTHGASVGVNISKEKNDRNKANDQAISKVQTVSSAAEDKNETDSRAKEEHNQSGKADDVHSESIQRTQKENVDNQNEQEATVSDEKYEMKETHKKQAKVHFSSNNKPEAKVSKSCTVL
ncbi:hypothetical protein ACJMK2_036015 [Sinanodonta woodiana]|uniref:TIR domain-containing protein n=1 Tax=Sinanodonta woodiana TaxID=1069815 RepID=A0ABD3WHJ0_SINWO